MNDKEINQYIKDLADDMESKGLAMIAAITSAEADQIHTITHSGDVIARDTIGCLVVSLLQHRADFTSDDLNNIATVIAKALLPDYPLPRAH